MPSSEDDNSTATVRDDVAAKQSRRIDAATNLLELTNTALSLFDA
jgi:hypothetical protein